MEVGNIWVSLRTIVPLFVWGRAGLAVVEVATTLEAVVVEGAAGGVWGGVAVEGTCVAVVFSSGSTGDAVVLLTIMQYIVGGKDNWRGFSFNGYLVRQGLWLRPCTLRFTKPLVC